MANLLEEPLDELLDEAILRQWHNGSAGSASIDADHAAEIQPMLDAASTLDLLMPVRMVEPAMLAADREQFLSELTGIHVGAVVPIPLARLKGWLDQQLFPIRQMFRVREQNQMSMLLARAALPLIVAFGSVGGTAALAAESLPDTALYPFKLSLEQARLTLTGDPAEQAMLQLGFAEERMGEIERMAREERFIDEEPVLRLREHLGQTFYLATQLSDETMACLLEQVQEMAIFQQQFMIQTREGASEQIQTMLLQTEQIMACVREATESGLSDPAQFRRQYSHGVGQPFGPDTDSPGYSPGPAECPEVGDCEPAGDPTRHGQDSDDPGGHGAGPAECAEAGDCESAGAQNQYGGDGDDPGHHGDGPAGCADGDECEPAGDQNQYGQGDEEPGQHGPGPADCPEPGECEPAGDQSGERGGPGPGEPEQNQEQNREQNGDGSNGNGVDNNDGSSGNSGGGSDSGGDNGGSDQGGSDSGGGSGGSDQDGSDSGGGSGGSGGSGGGSGGG